MADARGRPPAPLNTDQVKQDLLENPQSFGFFQAIRLLRLFAGQQGLHDDERFLTENLRVRPHLSLGFPGTDLVEMREERGEEEEDSGLRYHITATFLGLYGSASPLPTFYTEELLDDANDDIDVARDFIDIVNSPLYPLIIRAWTKYRLPIKVVDEQAKEYIERLFCLAGLGLPELRATLSEPTKLLRYIGLFSQWPRSALGLKTLLGDTLGMEETESPGPVPVQVTPCVLRQVKIPDDQRCTLGQANHQLGEDAVCGEQIADRLGKIAVHVGPLSDRLYHACLPGSPLFHWITVAVRLYMAQPLDCDLELKLAPEQARTARLGGGKWSALGLDTWIFSSEQPEKACAWFPIKEYTLQPTQGAAP